MPSRFNRRKRRSGRRKRKMPIVKLIKRVIHSTAEHKYVNSSFDTTSVTESAPIDIPLTTIVEGSAFDRRDGLIVTPSRLKIRFGIFNSDGAVASSIRVYVIQSMDNTDPSAMPDVELFMPPLQNANFAYRILYDRTFQLGLGLNRNIFRNINIRGKKMSKLRWGSTAGDDLTEGRIRLHVVTNSTLADDIAWTSVHRLYFTDV